MKAFVTGGTGFVGRPVVRKLVERGYEVHALVRSEGGAAALQAAGTVPVWGDITDLDSMRAGMAGSDLVFHIAGWYKIGSRDQDQAEKVNVEGTRNVLSLAHELGVPKIVYASTVAVFGDTRGKLVDESFSNPGDGLITEYDRTKWKAHYEVAEPLIRAGAPVVIVQPGAVYGPGDQSLVGEMMRSYYRGLFPLFPAPEMTITFAHVEDIAEGILLAAEKGIPGESYILAGPAVPLGAMVKLWAEVSGRPAPLFSIPPQLMKPFAPVMGAIGSILPLPELLSEEAIHMLDVSYIARSDKAREQLGWRTRPLADGMRETFEWIAQTTRPVEVPAVRKRQAAAFILGAALALLLARRLGRRR